VSEAVAYGPGDHGGFQNKVGKFPFHSDPPPMRQQQDQQQLQQQSESSPHLEPVRPSEGPKPPRGISARHHPNKAERQAIGDTGKEREKGSSMASWMAEQVQEVFNLAPRFKWHVVSVIDDEPGAEGSAEGGRTTWPQFGGSEHDTSSSAVLVLTAALSLRSARRWLRRTKIESVGPPVIIVIYGSSESASFQAEVVKAQREFFSLRFIDDVIVNPGCGNDLRLAISMSLVRAEVKQKMQDRHEEEIDRVERILSNESGVDMFWQTAHRVFEEFPPLCENITDVLIQGGEVGDCILDKPLGQGGFGEVWSAINCDTGEHEAVKSILKTGLNDLSSVGRLWREIKVLRRLRHENVIQFYSAWQGPRHIFIRMEMAGKHNLYQVLRKRKCGIKIEQVMKLLGELASAVGHVHERGVAHRDLKPENIGLSSQMQVKVLDFGSVTPLTKPCCDMAGTMPFMAPEILVADNTDYYDPSGCDVWSCAGVLLEMLCGPDKLGRMMGWTSSQEPGPERSSELRTFLTVDHGLRAAVETDIGHVSGHLMELLCGMLEMEPAARWSVRQVSQSRWVASAQ